MTTNLESFTKIKKGEKERSKFDWKKVSLKEIKDIKKRNGNT